MTKDRKTGKPVPEVEGERQDVNGRSAKMTICVSRFTVVGHNSSTHILYY